MIASRAAQRSAVDPSSARSVRIHLSSPLPASTSSASNAPVHEADPHQGRRLRFVQGKGFTFQTSRTALDLLVSIRSRLTPSSYVSYRRARSVAQLPDPPAMPAVDLRGFEAMIRTRSSARTSKVGDAVPTERSRATANVSEDLGKALRSRVSHRAPLPPTPTAPRRRLLGRRTLVRDVPPRAC